MENLPGIVFAVVAFLLAFAVARIAVHMNRIKLRKREEERLALLHRQRQQQLHESPESKNRKKRRRLQQQAERDAQR